MVKSSANLEFSTLPGSIFSQPWWLEAVAPGSWGEVLVQRNQELVARFAYVIKHRFGLTQLIMPPLTQSLGPWTQQSPGKYANQLSYQHELFNELIARLPHFHSFSQNFHYSITNWLPFYWNGFTSTTRYTYVLEDLTDLDRIWKNFRENARRNIRKAQKQLKILSELDIYSFLNLHEMTFTRQGMRLPYSPDLVIRLDNATKQRGCRKIFAAQDSRGRLHAAIYIIWDSHSAYYLMGGSDPDLRDSEANSLLIWEAIRFSASVTRSFDFEGSMIGSIERFFRSFGATQKPYFHVTKTNFLPLKIFQDIRSWRKFALHG